MDDQVNEGKRRSWLTNLVFQNWISLTGLVASGSATFAFIFLVAIDLLAHEGNPYMGILAYLVAPAFFFLGVFLIALGWWIHRRTAGHPEGRLAILLNIDLSNPEHLRRVVVVMSAASVFLLISAFGSYQTYHYTESVGFCGQVCHTVMEPEFTTYLHSPHARVSCSDCHIGSGAEWYVKAKLSGVRQVFATIAASYARPVATPISNLRPAQDTCEQCHWPEKFSGDRIKTYRHFVSDEENTPYSVKLELKVGGGDPTVGPAGGIHWHMNIANKVEYIATDQQRQEIPWIRVTDRRGEVRVFATEEYRDAPPEGEMRTMDCIDCHNRPAHRFKSPNFLVEQAMSLGRFDLSLPKLKAHAVGALEAEYETVEEAMDGISAVLQAAYPDQQSVQGAIEEVQRIYRANFFPAMKARWDAYPDNIGHMDWLGCFRCHDDEHEALNGGRLIKSHECNECHVILAQGDGDQMLAGDLAGLEFDHPTGEAGDFLCNDCHTGANQ